MAAVERGESVQKDSSVALFCQIFGTDLYTIEFQEGFRTAYKDILI